MKILSLIITVLVSLASIKAAAQLNDAAIETYLLKSRTVDEFLGKIKQDPKTQIYLTNYIPIWESSSLQESFSFCPRILMANQDHTLVLSFVACPKFISERDDIEIVQWNSKEEKYELYSVHYRLNYEPVQHVTLGAKNPDQCMQCHKGGIAIGAYDPFYFKNSASASWIENNHYFTNTIMKTGVHQFSPSSAVKIDRYLNFLDKSTLDITENSTSIVDSFNKGMADRNHLRTVNELKNQLNTLVSAEGGYNRLKYSVLSALSDCSNFTKMIEAKNPAYPPYSPEELREDLYQKNLRTKDRLAADERYQQILSERLGKVRMFSDFFYSDSVEERNFHDTIRSAVQKLYYVFYSFHSDSRDMQESIRIVNVNPIKGSFHPSWHPVETAIKMIETDPDLKDLSEYKNLLRQKASVFRNSILDFSDAQFNKFCERISQKYQGNN
ncbi:MAG: hypothetical protein V4654_14465 [Bdellovibrionota bacterium]